METLELTKEQKVFLINQLKYLVDEYTEDMLWNTEEGTKYHSSCNSNISELKAIIEVIEKSL